MKINRTVIIIILSGIYIGLILSGAFRKLEYLEGDVSDTGAEEKRVNGSMLPFTDAFPEHWGERPRVETADIKAFPPEFGGIGGRSGSSTMYSWISENLQMDKDNGIDYISLIHPDPEYELDGRFYTTPMPSPPDREFDELKLAAAVLAQAETATDEPSDKKNMNIGIGIGVGVLALFLILFTYYKLRRRY